MGKSKNSDASFIMQGSILAIASIISRIVGLIYRIPLTAIIGKTGNDYKLPTSGDIYAATGSGTEKINIPKGGTTTTGKNGPDTVYTVKGTGNGHNVGMSQWGAYSRAKHYKNTYIQILEFYYDGAKVEKAS